MYWKESKYASAWSSGECASCTRDVKRMRRLERWGGWPAGIIPKYGGTHVTNSPFFYAFWVSLMVYSSFWTGMVWYGMVWEGLEARLIDARTYVCTDTDGWMGRWMDREVLFCVLVSFCWCVWLFASLVHGLVGCGGIVLVVKEGMSVGMRVEEEGVKEAEAVISDFSFRA